MIKLQEFIRTRTPKNLLVNLAKDIETRRFGNMFYNPCVVETLKNALEKEYEA